MDVSTGALLAVAGVFAGVLSAIVGGAAVISYPALIAAGLTPQHATVCNLVAMTPGNMLAALADRTQLPAFNRAFLGMVAGSLIGAGVGAMLLLVTPQRTFAIIVPLLLGFATVLFASAERISVWLRNRAGESGLTPSFGLTSLKMLLPVSFYGGYFGAGAGILILGVLSIATGGDYRSANVAKNFVTSLNSFMAGVVFVAHGVVAWPQTLTMMAGSIAGGFIGSHLARIIPRQWVRVLVVVVGAGLTVAFARRYWFN